MTKHPKLENNIETKKPINYLKITLVINVTFCYCNAASKPISKNCNISFLSQVYTQKLITISSCHLHQFDNKKIYP